MHKEGEYSSLTNNVHGEHAIDLETLVGSGIPLENRGLRGNKKIFKKQGTVFVPGAKKSNDHNATKGSLGSNLGSHTQKTGKILFTNWQDGRQISTIP